MKKSIALNTLALVIISTALLSCSKKSQGEILPLNTATEFTAGNTVAKADTPYGKQPRYYTAAKADTPYGKKPIRVIPAAKVDTPYGK